MGKKEKQTAKIQDSQADPEVAVNPKRRKFTAAYKLRILEQADRCEEHGGIGELLRQEGLYSSHLTTWRRQRTAGQLQALTIAQEIGARRNEGGHLGNLGVAYRALGQVEKGVWYYEQALTIAQEIGDRRGEGAWLVNLGIVYSDLGRVEKAQQHLKQALVIFEEIKSPNADLVRKWLEALGDTK